MIKVVGRLVRAEHRKEKRRDTQGRKRRHER